MKPFCVEELVSEQRELVDEAVLRLLAVPAGLRQPAWADYVAKQDAFGVALLRYVVGGIEEDKLRAVAERACDLLDELRFRAGDE